MANTQMPNIPGIGSMTDTLEFVKSLWGSMNIPGVSPNSGITVPTLSVEELDKKIADLKAVESWLNVNLSMLRGTIQAMEVQRGTIVTLKSMGDSFAAAVKQPDATEKSLLESIPYASAFLFPGLMGAAASAASGPVAAAAATRPAPVPPPAPAPAAACPEPQPAAGGASGAEAEGGKSRAHQDFAAQMTNPTAWWNVLQDQFKQVVEQAIAPDVVGKFGAMAAQSGTLASDPAKPSTRTTAKSSAVPKPGDARVDGQGAAAARAVPEGKKPTAKPKVKAKPV